MKHQIREEQGHIIVSFEGDVDMQNSPEARSVLLKSLEKKLPLLVDLSQVSYIDSSGVASLVESLQTAKRNNCEFALVSVSDEANRVLQLARLDKIFTIFESLEEGLAGSAD
jgi:anti-sigma B factor antagonist